MTPPLYRPHRGHEKGDQGHMVVQLPEEKHHQARKGCGPWQPLADTDSQTQHQGCRGCLQTIYLNSSEKAGFVP